MIKHPAQAPTAWPNADFSRLSPIGLATPKSLSREPKTRAFMRLKIHVPTVVRNWSQPSGVVRKA